MWVYGVLSRIYSNLYSIYIRGTITLNPKPIHCFYIPEVEGSIGFRSYGLGFKGLGFRAQVDLGISVMWAIV